MVVCVWRKVKVGEVENEVRVVFAGAHVWAMSILMRPVRMRSNCSAIAVEVGATALFECRG